MAASGFLGGEKGGGNAAQTQVNNNNTNGDRLGRESSTMPMTTTASNSTESNQQCRPWKMARKRMASEMEVQLNDDYYRRFPRRNSSNSTPNAIASPLLNYSTINNNLNMNMLLPSSTNLSCIDDFSPDQQQSQSQPQAPAVCGFSGLPLFPPERSREASTNGLIPATMEDCSATAWIDSIIKDLIHNSTNVSISQLIHNVRDIIFPCNPNLAVLLE